ncbi:MAG: site-specific DNA-methyltransferase [Chloroflexi bacterium]|nr:site-specific DNA-methyltransferase [Chloroflexota bacterium]
MSNASCETFLGDCLTGMAAMPARSIDVIVTSPPYNLGVRYGHYQDNGPREDYLRWLGDWTAAAARVLAPAGSLFLNVGSKPSDPLVPFQVLQIMTQTFKLQNVIHWIKSITIDSDAVGAASSLSADLSVGHFKPINSTRFINDCHEYVFHLTHTGDVPLDRLAVGVPYQDKSNVTRWHGANKRDLRCRGNTWFIPYDTIQKRSSDRPHPASFPPHLPEQCILLHGRDRVRTVLDPFMGIGSTGIACRTLGVGFVGFEIDPDYLHAARQALT